MWSGANNDDFAALELSSGDVIECCGYGYNFRAQGTYCALVQKVFSKDSQGLFFLGEHLGSSDSYYHWWSTFGDGAGQKVFHFCRTTPDKCAASFLSQQVIQKGKGRVVNEEIPSFAARPSKKQLELVAAPLDGTPQKGDTCIEPDIGWSFSRSRSRRKSRRRSPERGCTKARRLGGAFETSAREIGRGQNEAKASTCNRQRGWASGFPTGRSKGSRKRSPHPADSRPPLKRCYRSDPKEKEKEKEGQEETKGSERLASQFPERRSEQRSSQSKRHEQHKQLEQHGAAERQRSAPWALKDTQEKAGEACCPNDFYNERLGRGTRGNNIGKISTSSVDVFDDDFLWKASPKGTGCSDRKRVTDFNDNYRPCSPRRHGESAGRTRSESQGHRTGHSGQTLGHSSLAGTSANWGCFVSEQTGSASGPRRGSKRIQNSSVQAPSEQQRERLWKGQEQRKEQRQGGFPDDGDVGRHSVGLLASPLYCPFRLRGYNPREADVMLRSWLADERVATAWR
eukprot:6474902-Amphidinium_carterae.1